MKRCAKACRDCVKACRDMIHHERNEQELGQRFRVIYGLTNRRAGP
jgi:hypothetical protein